MDRETKILAGVAFLISFIFYAMTVSPSVSFWDCGEFTACSYIMGVPHPPGAPLFILLGKIFTLFPGFDTSLKTNMMSVFCTALTITVLFLIIGRLIREWRGKPESIEDRVIMNAGAFIGAMSLAFTDTLWFNAVETEVYALSILLTALVFWLALLWMDNYEDYKSVRFLLLIIYLFGIGAGVHLLNLVVIPSILWLIIVTDRRILTRFGFVPTIVVLFIVPILLFMTAYSSYLMIYIRSGLQPAINENDPSNWTNFLAYLKREQYGTESQFATVFQRKAPFWTYQIKKMFLRYFSWQFIGKGTTLGPDGYIAENLSFRGLYGIPFLLGLIGVVHHFFKDWKRAFSVVIFFIMTGIALVVYQNQADPQPRERDYFYVGAFLAFAIWIGTGAVGILESIVNSKLRDNRRLMWAAVGVTILVMLLVIPVNMIRVNYHEHDRSGNYVPWDYSYNILQSCEPNAVLFTNGDNDTFPLWYLQEVDGVRKDVRIANLSLLNTNWYIKQLKHQEPKVPISLSDAQIEKIGPMRHKKQTYKINVPNNVVKAYMGDVEAEIDIGDGPAEMEFEVAPTFGAEGLKLQDYMVLNIIHSNMWRRPIYFALTVSSGNFVGLKEYCRMDGMAMKIIPFKNVGISESRLRKNLFDVFKFRGLNDPSIYYDEQSRGLLQNYRTLFTQLAYRYYVTGKKDKIPEVLDKMEEIIPSSIISWSNIDFDIQVGKMYADCGRTEELRKRLDLHSEDKNIDFNRLYDYGALYHGILHDSQKAIEMIKRVIEMKPDLPKAYSLLIFLYDREKMYRKEFELINKWLIVNPNDKGARNKLEELRKMIAEQDSTVK